MPKTPSREHASSSSFGKQLPYVAERSFSYLDRALDSLYLTTRIPMVADSFVVFDSDHIQDYYNQCYQDEDWIFGLLGAAIFFMLIAIGSEIYQDYEKRLKNAAAKKKAEEEAATEEEGKKEERETPESQKFSEISHPADLRETVLKTLLLILFVLYVYGRDFFSGLKNGRQAVVNVALLFKHFNIHVYAIADPIGIAVGAIYCLLMLGIRKIENNRRAQMNAQYEALEQLRELMNIEDLAKKLIEIAKIDKAFSLSFAEYSKKQKGLNYALKATHGILDGAYTFGCGVFVLSTLPALSFLNLTAAVTLSPTILFYLGMACIAVTLLTLISELLKEYELQKQYDLNIKTYQDVKAKIKQTDEGIEEQPETPKNHPNQNVFIKKTLIIFHTTFRAMIQGVKNMRFVLQALSWLVHQFFQMLAVVLAVGISYGCYLIYRDTKAFSSRFKSPSYFFNEKKPAEEKKQTEKTEKTEQTGYFDGFCNFYSKVKAPLKATGNPIPTTTISTSVEKRLSIKKV